MTDISNLKPSILSLSESDAFALIKESRALRRILLPIKPRKTKKTKKASKQLSLEDMLGKMSQIQADKLLIRLKAKMTK